MKKLLPFMVVLLMLTACNQDDNTQPTTPIEPIIFSDAEVGQKFLYQRYVVNNLDSLPGSFEWRDDTLVLEVTGLEQSRVFLQESLTEYSENYYENTTPAQYALDFEDDKLLLTEASGLFSPYREDTLRLYTISDTLLHDFSAPSNGGFIPEFELGEISLKDKSVVCEIGVWTTDILFYDNEKVCATHILFFDDVSPFNVSASGWSLIEE